MGAPAAKHRRSDGFEPLAAAGQAWVAVSESGTIVGWNRWAQRLLGWSRDEALGRPLAGLRLYEPADPARVPIPAGSREELVALVGRRLAITARHRLGHEVDLEFSVSMREEPDGLIFHAFVQDVTAMRRLERFLAAQRAVSGLLVASPALERLLPEAVATLARSLAADAAVLWTPGPAGDLVAAEALGLDAQPAPEPPSEVREQRQAGWRRLDGPGHLRSALWIPVCTGRELDAVIGLMTRRVHEVEHLALEVLNAIGAQIGHAVHERRSEAAMRALGEQNRRILEAASDSIIGFGGDGIVTFANRAAAAMLGVQVDDVVGRNLHALVHGDGDHGPEECELVRAARERRRLPFADDRFRTAEGPRLVERSCAPLDDAGASAVLTFHDVQERRELDAARQRDLDFLQTLLDSMEEGVMACDREGRLTLFNRPMRDLIGPAVAGGPEGWADAYGVRDPVTGEPMRMEDLPLYRALQGEPIAGAELLVRSTEGELRRLTAIARPLVDADGRRLGAVGTVRDVTELHVAAQRMEEAERLALLGNWEHDLETRDVLWSAGIFRIFGLEPGSVEPSEEEWLARVHPDDLERLLEETAAALEADVDAWEQEYRMVAAGGSTQRMRSRVEKIRRADGTVARLRGTLQDVTAQAEAEAALRRTQARALQSDRMDSLGQLAGGIAHDFNNLLAVILTYTELALDDLPPEAPPRLEVEEIRKAAQRAAELTQRLLVFSRGEAVRAELVDVGRLVREFEPLLERTLGEQLELRLEIEPGLEPVSADASQLEQVLLNLSLNARDAMPGGGVLQISVGRADVGPGHDHLQPGRYVRLEVTDSGVGMSAEVAAHVFEPFFTTKPKGRGTGLGLATAYGVVHEAGGAIAVDSTPGRGSTFTVHLPAATGTAPGAPRQAGRAAPPATADAAARAVLVVEDDDGVRAATSQILERAGYEVVQAAGGAEALDLLAHCDGDVHLLLTDVVMPGMSGRELHTRVLERWPALPTLFMSGYTEELVDREALSGERVEFIAKPFSSRALLEMVERLGAGQPQRHAIRSGQ